MPGVKGSIEALRGHKWISASDVHVELESWGRPDTKAEIGMQAVKPRKSYYIWNKSTVILSCSSGSGTYKVLSYEGSKFPSRKLWINGDLKTSFNFVQGALSDLWTEHPSFPRRVAP